MASGAALDRLAAARRLPPASSCAAPAATAWSRSRRIPTSTSCCAPRPAPTALEAVLAAIEHGKTIALANKEVLVMAGGIVTEAARRHGVAILPVDSEHNAIHQCLHGRDRVRAEAAGADRVGRTVSRPHRRLSSRRSRPTDALQHPTWRMGRKITIDSATLMNKGLEVIEAHWLFGVRRGSDRRRDSSAVGRALDGRAGRRLDHRAARRDRHAAADSVRVLVSRALGRAAAVARSGARRAARVRRAGHRGVSLSGAGLPCARGGAQPAGRPERGQRSRGGAVPRRAPRLHRDCPTSSKRRWTRISRRR